MDTVYIFLFFSQSNSWLDELGHREEQWDFPTDRIHIYVKQQVILTHDLLWLSSATWTDGKHHGQPETSGHEAKQYKQIEINPEDIFLVKT